MLDEISESDWCCHTLHLTPATLSQRLARMFAHPAHPEDEAMRIILQTVGKSDTGLVLFLGQGRAVAVRPPFPLSANARSDGADTGRLRQLLHTDFVVGVVVLRIGRYAVGVLRGSNLVASKTSARYVKNRHRAGGQSQRRFERSRERLTRELFDKTCEVAAHIFSPFGSDIDHIMMGGERNTLAGLMQRCRCLRDFGDKILDTRVAVDRPDRKALDNIAFEVWKSSVYSFLSIPEASN